MEVYWGTGHDVEHFGDPGTPGVVEGWAYGIGFYFGVLLWSGQAPSVMINVLYKQYRSLKVGFL